MRLRLQMPNQRFSGWTNFTETSCMIKEVHSRYISLNRIWQQIFKWSIKQPLLSVYFDFRLFPVLTKCFLSLKESLLWFLLKNCKYIHSDIIRVSFNRFGRPEIPYNAEFISHLLYRLKRKPLQRGGSRL